MTWRSKATGWAREAANEAFRDWKHWTFNGVCMCSDQYCVRFFGSTAYFAGAER